MTDRRHRAWTPGFLPGATHSLLHVVMGALFMKYSLQRLFGLLLSRPAPRTLRP
jgi:hypothetical protein